MKLVMKKSFDGFDKLKEVNMLNEGERAFSFSNVVLVFQKM